ACGPNMMTRNAYALNTGYVMEHAPVKPERALLEANMGGDKKPSHRYFERGGHGKTVLVEATLTDETVRRVLRTTVDDLLELSFAGTHGAVASGMQSVAFTPASAIAAIFAATGQDLGMVGTSSMAHGTGRRVDGGIHCALRLPGLEVGTVGGGTTLPYARAWLESIGCAGTGKVYRFAQIVAAATLALEISASAARASKTDAPGTRKRAPVPRAPRRSGRGGSARTGPHASATTTAAQEPRVARRSGRTDRDSQRPQPGRRPQPQGWSRARA